MPRWLRVQNINKSKELYYINCVLKVKCIDTTSLNNYKVTLNSCFFLHSHIKFLFFIVTLNSCVFFLNSSRYFTLKFRPWPKRYICCLPQFTFIEYLVNWVLLSTGLLKLNFHIFASNRVFDWTVQIHIKLWFVVLYRIFDVRNV